MPTVTAQPRLTVVVPVYNVEEYLTECLESIAGQTFPDFECLLVDDGSTDDSPRIAQEFAARDPRFRYLRQENAGLSAARNTGVRESSRATAFLTFVDSDDIVVHDAYERMITSLDATGSDFATGNVWRLGERGRYQAWQYTWLTAPRESTHVTRDLDLLADRVAWNKVFRRKFWDRHGLTFPEGRLYEDTPVMIPAHFLSGAVDVLADHVYYWRVREGSITRRRTDVKGVRDRIAACDHVSRFLSVHAPAHKKTYDASCLRDDFLYFLDGLPMGGPEYRGAFLDGTAEFLRRAAPDVVADLPVDLRVKWQLVRERRLSELVELLAAGQRGGDAFRVRGSVRRRAEYPGVGPVPEKAARLRRGDLPVVARVRDAGWQDDGTLRVSGYAYVRNLETGKPGASGTDGRSGSGGHVVRTGLLRHTRSRTQMRRVPVRTVIDPLATENSRQRLHCYDASGFEMVIDPERLKIRGRWRPGTWLLGMVVAGHGGVRRSAVRAIDGAAARSVVRELGDGMRMTVGYSRGRLVVRISAYAALVQEHRRDGDDLVLGGRVRGIAPTALRLTHPRAGTEFDYPVTLNGERFEVRLPVTDLEAVPPAPHLAPKEVEPPHGDRWQVNLVLPDETLKSVAAALALPPGRYATRPGREVCAMANDRGQLVVELTRQPFASALTWADDGTVTLSGPVADESWGPAELVLRHSGLGEEITVPLEREPGRYSARFTPGGGALFEGRWYVFLRETGVRGGEGSLPGRAEDGVPVRLLAPVAAGLPVRRASGGRAGGGGREFTLDVRFGDRLVILAGSVLAPEERGAYRSHRLRTLHYPAQRALPLRDAVLYFDGDSPRAVHDELVRRGTEVDHLWVTRDRRTPVPPAARGVEEHSTAWYEALARCRRIVTARHLPDWFERRTGQTVVQTWHGAPLKRVGADLTDTLYADHAHLDHLPSLSRQWDVLVSPNRFSTPRLARALGFEGEVLEAGSPRNDLLFAEDRDKIAERVRRKLGIEPGRRVVLYAPTYRDHLPHSQGRFRYDGAFDFRAAEQALGEDHLLLVRKHPLTAGRLTGARAPFVRDVTGHPRATELLLVADVLVTDYSALMFDFAHTGRPMLFHTYDLAHYRDTVRGFYLDFEAGAPGPLLTSTDEVIAALRDLDGVTARHAEAYAAFRQAYCDLDDGQATARVVERLMR
ncbi:CDP-glycerol glycerophosphotransferase family protein [Streptomyces sp. NPDC091292]|uniref:bifunctional glycosyltransferase/CDP-glycerol:glycerophosphate glycerophosphotransferase n=1 Tax=Streptomyces sp. NPDC091292 TaxID=3365991 RepID=UPI0037F21643